MYHRFYRMIPMVFIMGIIFFLSHQPGDTLHLPAFWGADKVAHFLAYSTLAATVVFAYSAESRVQRPYLIFVSTVLVTFLYGLSDEFHQSFIPGRFVSVGDVLADTCGGLFVGCLFLFLRMQCKK